MQPTMKISTSLGNMITNKRFELPPKLVFNILGKTSEYVSSFKKMLELYYMEGTYISGLFTVTLSKAIWILLICLLSLGMSSNINTLPS